MCVQIRRRRSRGKRRKRRSANAPLLMQRWDMARWRKGIAGKTATETLCKAGRRREDLNLSGPAVVKHVWIIN